MNVLITGVAGFIGSTFADFLLKNGHNVIGVDNLSFGDKRNIPSGSNFEFIELDIRSREILKTFKNVDTVFHFAGISSLPECQSNPGEAFSINVGGTANILECSRLSGVSKVVIASTSAVYENNQSTPFFETEAVNPDLIYSHSKLICEQMARNYTSNYGMPTRAIRFFNVYGPHQSYLRKSPPLLGYIVSSVLKNETPQFFSDGHQKRDYIFIDDLMELLNKFTETRLSGFEIYNACSGNIASVREIYHEVQKLIPNSKDAIYAESGSFWNNYPELSLGNYPLQLERIKKEVNKFSMGSYSKAQLELNWNPKVSLSEGISKVLKYVLENTEIINPSTQGK